MSFFPQTQVLKDLSQYITVVTLDGGTCLALNCGTAVPAFKSIQNRGI